MGKPVISGTRITVELILEKLAAGETIEQILEAHPRLTQKAIQAALAFAANWRRFFTGWRGVRWPRDWHGRMGWRSSVGGTICVANYPTCRQQNNDFT